MVIIGTEKRIDWNAIRSEYVAGGCSYRTLAEKHGITKDAIARRAKSEGWDKDRDKARDRAATKIIQKTADAVADNAVIAERVKQRLLLRLERIEAKYPLDATEVRTRQGNSTAIFKMTDLTRAWRDLTDDMPKAQDKADDPLEEMLKRWDDAAGE